MPFRQDNLTVSQSTIRRVRGSSSLRQRVSSRPQDVANQGLQAVLESLQSSSRHFASQAAGQFYPSQPNKLRKELPKRAHPVISAPFDLIHVAHGDAGDSNVAPVAIQAPPLQFSTPSRVPSQSETPQLGRRATSASDEHLVVDRHEMGHERQAGHDQSRSPSPEHSLNCFEFNWRDIKIWQRRKRRDAIVLQSEENRMLREQIEFLNANLVKVRADCNRHEKTADYYKRLLASEVSAKLEAFSALQQQQQQQQGEPARTISQTQDQAVHMATPYQPSKQKPPFADEVGEDEGPVDITGDELHQTIPATPSEDVAVRDVSSNVYHKTSSSVAVPATETQVEEFYEIYANFTDLELQSWLPSYQQGLLETSDISDTPPTDQELAESEVLRKTSRNVCTGPDITPDKRLSDEGGATWNMPSPTQSFFEELEAVPPGERQSEK